MAGQGGCRTAEGREAARSTRSRAPTRCTSPSSAPPSGTSSTTTWPSATRCWRPPAGRPALLERFPDGAAGKSFFQKRVPPGRARVARDHGGGDAQRHHLQRAGHRRPGARAVGGQPRVPGAPRLALPGRRPGPRRRAAHRPRPPAGHGIRRGPPRRRAHTRALLDELGIDGPPEDDRQPGHPRLRAPRAPLGQLPGARRRGGRGPGARAPAPGARSRPSGGRRSAGARCSSTSTRTPRTRPCSAPGSPVPGPGGQVSTPALVGRGRRRSSPTPSRSSRSPAASRAGRPVGATWPSTHSRSSPCWPWRRATEAAGLPRRAVAARVPEDARRADPRGARAGPRRQDQKR